MSKTKGNAITTLFACLLPNVGRKSLSVRRTLYKLNNFEFLLMQYIVQGPPVNLAIWQRRFSIFSVSGEGECCCQVAWP